MDFTTDELARYQRHFALGGFGAEAQAALKRGRVLVIGAGGLGCPVLLYLAAAGVGRITVLDPDFVDISNLQRQILFSSTDASTRAPKALAAAQRLRVLNPLVMVEGRVEKFSRANASALVAAHDVVVDASDNFATRYLVNDACVLGGKPFVYGAIHGFEGQASVFNWRGGPTYRCLFPNQSAAGAVRNCAEAGVLGVLPGLVGTVQATEVIKLLTGIGDPLSGRLWIWDALAMSSRSLRVARDSAGLVITQLPADDLEASCASIAKCDGLDDEISADELRLILKNENVQVQLLDVRELWEREAGAITPSLHVPLGVLESADSLDFDASVHTVVYCAAGGRSMKALKLLRDRYGFERVQSLHGGMRAW